MWKIQAGRVLLLALVTTVPASTGYAAAPGGHSGGAGTGGGAGEAACAVEVPAAQLTVTDLRAGVLLSYTTQPNLVGAVQRLVRNFADRQNGGSPVGQQFGDPRLQGGVVGAPPGTDVLVPGAHAEVANTVTGARLTLGPVAPPIRRLLRAAAEEQGRLERRRPCPPDLRLTPAPPGASDVPRPG